MFVVSATSVARPPGQLPNAHRSAGIATLGARTPSRTVNVECAVLVSAVSDDRKFGLPPSLGGDVPRPGILPVRRLIRTGATIGLPASPTPARPHRNQT